MSFQPVVPSGGLVGWRFLERTMESQSAAFAKSPALQRDTAYFEANIGKIDTAADLVADRRLLRVALGAFGLQDDIDNRYFIRKILEEGTLQPDSLANKLSDSRYRSLSKAFGFGDFGVPNTKLSTFAADIVGKYRRQQFEVAVGQQDDSMRLALNASRTLGEIAEAKGSSETKWFRIMGSTPLRKVFETALGLPSSFAQIDLDKQLEILRDRSRQQLGSDEVDQFSSPEAIETLVQRYVLRAQMSNETVLASGSIALSLLQSVPSPVRRNT